MNKQDLLPRGMIANRFSFKMEGLLEGGFSRVKNIERRVKREEYNEGGSNMKPVILAGQQTSSNKLVLEKGYIVSKDSMFKKLNQELSNQKHIFRSGTLSVLDKSSNPVRTFYFEKGIISEWSISDLDAKSPGIMMERIIIVHSGLIEETDETEDIAQGGDAVVEPEPEPEPEPEEEEQQEEEEEEEEQEEEEEEEEEEEQEEEEESEEEQEQEEEPEEEEQEEEQEQEEEPEEEEQ